MDLQQLIAQWKERGEDTEYETLITAAENAEIDSIEFVWMTGLSSPLNMEKAIADYCREHRLAVPKTCGEYVLVYLNRSRNVINKSHSVKQLVTVTCYPTSYHRGGCRNRLLNRLTEEALGIRCMQVLLRPLLLEISCASFGVWGD